MVLYKQTKTFTVTPGDSVIVTVANTANVPKSNPSGDSTRKLTDSTSSQSEPISGRSGDLPSVSADDLPNAGSSAAALASSSTPKALTGALAHTGAEDTSWIAAGAACLIGFGAITLVICHRSSNTSGSEGEGKANHIR